MNDTPDTTPNGTPEPLVADTRGSDFQLQSYDIDPEDAALAEEIAGFDPLNTKGPVSVIGAVKLPTTMKATGLPDHLRTSVQSELAKVPPERRDEAEATLVYAALRQNSYEVRVAAGPGSEANLYEKEFFLLEHDRFQAGQEIDRIGHLLAEVNETASIVMDPSTGRQRVETTPRLQGQQRQAMEAEYGRALNRFAQLNGLEGERRLAKAKFEAVAEVKALRAQLDEDREARKRGDEQLREERIAERAKLYAKHRRTVS